MIVKIKTFIRKTDHYKQPKGEKYNIKEGVIIGESEQDIFDKFYKKNRRADNSYYNEFKKKEWKEKLSNWYKSEDFKKRSFDLYYHNSIVD